MRRIPFLPVLVMICLLCGADTCTEEGSRNASPGAGADSGIIDSIRIAFGSPHPEAGFLRENEEAAIQKLSDFADYLNIASDTVLDTTFRRQASELAVRSFASAATPAGSFCPSCSKGGTVTDLALACLGNTIPFKFIISGTEITEPLTLLNDSTCSGTLKFTLILFPKNDINASPSLQEDHSLTFFLSLKEKDFGDTALKVWTLWLHEIE